MIDLKTIRKSCGLTQKELAKKLGIGESTYAHYESGIRKITLDTFLRLLKVCNLEIKIKKKN